MKSSKEVKDIPNNGERVLKKKIWIKAAVLTLVFFWTFFASTFLVNTGNRDIVIDLGAPKLPRISFSAAGREINTLAGYVNEMDITAVRDTITPLSEGKTLTVNVKNADQEIGKLEYDVYSLDGKEVIERGSEALRADGSAVLNLKNVFGGGASENTPEERVLKVTLEYGEGKNRGKAFYFTRIIPSDNLSFEQCMDFAEDFHHKTFDKAAAVGELAGFLEPDGNADNATLEHVTIHSDIDNITWGDLSLNVGGNVDWRVTETNSVYTSVQAVYTVEGEGDNQEPERFNVKEFFRVRCIDGKMYLLNYDRTMNQVFDPEQAVLNSKGILLGIVPEDIDYMVNAGDKAAAFVQERDLWVYNKDTMELSLVFSFANGEDRDVRSSYSRHAVKIIGMEENGSTIFAVYGYMNRGNHEGEVGAAIYYFDIEENVVEEKAFIPIVKSYAMAEHELGKMIYYAHERQILYMLAGGRLFEIGLEKNDAKILEDGLSGRYVVSDDGHLLAYSDDGEDGCFAVALMDLKTGSSNVIKAPAGEKICALGFIRNDLIYGLWRPQDRGRTATGEEISPMYKLEIADINGKVIKEYSAEGMFLSGISVDQNFVAIHRVLKSDGIYEKCEDDYISNNEKREEREISMKTFFTKLKKRQMLLNLSEDQSDKPLKILRPGQIPNHTNISVPFEDETEGEVYYVYGLGRQEGVFYDVASAIEKAQSVSGVVISKEQSYVWEKGNRDLMYYTEAEEFKAGEGESSLDACERALEKYEGNRVDFTGCTLSQIYYIIGKGAPVIMMPDKESAILITGYSTINVEYIDPVDGEKHYEDIDKMEEMAEGGGNVFIGKIK